MAVSIQKDELSVFLAEYAVILEKIDRVVNITVNGNGAGVVENLSEFYLQIKDLVGIAEFTNCNPLIEISTLLQKLSRYIIEGVVEITKQQEGLLVNSRDALVRIYKRIEQDEQLLIEEASVIMELQDFLSNYGEKEADTLLMDEDEKGVFLNELSEYIELFAVCCDNLSQRDPDEAVLFDFYKAMHTVKGFAAIIDFTALNSLAMALEKLFQEIKENKIKYSVEVRFVVETSREILLDMLDDVLENKTTEYELDELLARIKNLYEGSAKADIIFETLTAEDFIALSVELSGSATELAKSLMANGGEIFDILLIFDKNTEMKSVRCFQVIEALKLHGVILASKPSEYDVVELNLVDVGIKFVFYCNKCDDIDIKRIILDIVSLQTLMVKVREV